MFVILGEAEFGQVPKPFPYNPRPDWLIEFIDLYCPRVEWRDNTNLKWLNEWTEALATLQETSWEGQDARIRPAVCETIVNSIRATGVHQEDKATLLKQLSNCTKYEAMVPIIVKTQEAFSDCSIVEL